MRVRIFMVSNMFPSRKDVMYGIFVKNFMTSLQAEGCIVEPIAVIRGHGRNLISKLLKYFSLYLQVLFVGIRRRRSYDIIYVHSVSHTSPVILVLAAFLQKIIVLNVHGDDVRPVSAVAKFAQGLVRRLISRADLVVVPSQYFKGYVKSKFDLGDEKIFVSPSGGISPEFFENNRKETLKKSLALNGNLVIGFVSSINKFKGWDTYVRALALLKQQCMDVKFRGLIIGGLKRKSFF